MFLCVLAVNVCFDEWNDPVVKNEVERKKDIKTCKQQISIPSVGTYDIMLKPR